MRHSVATSCPQESTGEKPIERKNLLGNHESPCIYGYSGSAAMNMQANVKRSIAHQSSLFLRLGYHALALKMPAGDAIERMRLEQLVWDTSRLSNMTSRVFILQ